MYNDPIVEQTRKLRDEYAAKFNYDLDAICNDLMERQQKSDHTLVRRDPKRPTRAATSANRAAEKTDALKP